MTPAQRAANAALVRLDPDHPRFAGAPEVAALLRGLRIYLDSWVRPLLERSAGILPSAERGWVDRETRFSGAGVAAAEPTLIETDADWIPGGGPPATHSNDKES